MTYTATGTREQLAALLVEGQQPDDATGSSLMIHGTPGDWSVAVSIGDKDAMWLASERAKTVMRTFKSLDAAHAAAISVQRAAFPFDAGFASVRIHMHIHSADQ